MVKVDTDNTMEKSPSYTVKQLATLAGVSVRTLHYYDTIGLLSPSRKAENEYREYGEKELLLLQQILFFRELEFPLEEIKRIFASPEFDLRDALAEQKKFILLKRKRLDELVRTIDRSIKKITQKHMMEDDELYEGFSKEESEAYAQEAKERWGNTDAYKTSQERVKKMGKGGLARVGKEMEDTAILIALALKNGDHHESEAVFLLIERHYDQLRAFYEPNLELYRGLAEMYVADPRFTAYYEKYAPGLAQFMHDAMIAFCEKNASK